MRHRKILPAFLALYSAAAVPALSDVSAVDGDTFDTDGIRIRLNGIDAPEYGQACGSWKCSEAGLPAINAHGTVWLDCVAEGLWLILTQLELNMMKRNRDDQGTGRAGCEGHPARDTEASS